LLLLLLVLGACELHARDAVQLDVNSCQQVKVIHDCPMDKKP
jgi:hypothetical protein